MSATQPDSLPAVVRRKWQWLSPKRWRFWVVTLPLAFWIILMILVWWPGLTFSWRISETIYFEREHEHAWGDGDDGAIDDWANLRIGPLGFGKHTYPSDSRTSIAGTKGFRTLSDAGDHCVLYQWNSGSVSIGFSENHNPPNLLFRF